MTTFETVLSTVGIVIVMCPVLGFLFLIIQVIPLPDLESYPGMVKTKHEYKANRQVDKPQVDKPHLIDYYDIPIRVREEVRDASMKYIQLRAWRVANELEPEPKRTWANIFTEHFIHGLRARGWNVKTYNHKEIIGDIIYDYEDIVPYSK